MRMTVIILTLALLSSTAFAGVNFQQIDNDLYFVKYQMNRMMQGGIMFDSQKKNTKKLFARVHKICREEGFAYLHVVTAREIVQDETLRAYWEMFADGEMVTQTQVSGSGSTPGGRTNEIKRLVQFAGEPAEGFEACK